MRWAVLLFAALPLFTAGCKSSATTAQERMLTEEQQALQGKWYAVADERFGKPLPPERVERIRVIIDEDTLRFIESSKQDAALGVAPQDETTQFALDASQEPKAIDILVSKGPHAGKWAAGIYKLEGDVLRLCWAEPDKPRPTAFTTAGGTAAESVVLRRAK
jgi:uncharacterized protein (TIGR03067 family)